MAELVCSATINCLKDLDIAYSVGHFEVLRPPHSQYLHSKQSRPKYERQRGHVSQRDAFDRGQTEPNPQVDLKARQFLDSRLKHPSTSDSEATSMCETPSSTRHRLSTSPSIRCPFPVWFGRQLAVYEIVSLYSSFPLSILSATPFHPHSLFHPLSFHFLAAPILAVSPSSPPPLAARHHHPAFFAVASRRARRRPHPPRLSPSLLAIAGRRRRVLLKLTLKTSPHYFLPRRFPSSSLSSPPLSLSSSPLSLSSSPLSRARRSLSSSLSSLYVLAFLFVVFALAKFQDLSGILIKTPQDPDQVYRPSGCLQDLSGILSSLKTPQDFKAARRLKLSSSGSRPPAISTRKTSVGYCSRPQDFKTPQDLKTPQDFQMPQALKPRIKTTGHLDVQDLGGIPARHQDASSPQAPDQDYRPFGCVQDLRWDTVKSQGFKTPQALKTSSPGSRLTTGHLDGCAT
ncbi:hypothetical protein DFH06DRAFT_1387021 [Mycena polygramma]|nr:hypothetical protein DFH06DRAFT_1387021 [Mycena polygramma]